MNPGFTMLDHSTDLQ